MPDSQTLTWVWVAAAVVVVALASFLIWWFTKKECTTDENCKNNKTGTFCDVKVNKCVAKEYYYLPNETERDLIDAIHQTLNSFKTNTTTVEQLNDLKQKESSYVLWLKHLELENDQNIKSFKSKHYFKEWENLHKRYSTKLNTKLNTAQSALNLINISMTDKQKISMTDSYKQKLIYVLKLQFEDIVEDIGPDWYLSGLMFGSHGFAPPTPNI